MPILPRILLFLLIICMILGMLFVGLYPFNYFPENRVLVNEDGNGLHFFGRGIAYSTKIGDWPRKGPITLELVLEPERTYHHRTPHILSLCDKSGHEVMYLGQWENSIIIRLVEDSRWTERVKREIGAWGLLDPGEAVHISLVLSKGNAEIYANGQLVREFGEFDLTEAVSKRPIMSFVLGNSSTGDSPWKGKILGFTVLDGMTDPIAIRNRYEQWEANQTQDMQDIIVPEILTPIRKEFLSLPSREFLQRRAFYKDVIINVAGFIPLGLALTIFFSGIPFNKKYAISKFVLPVLVSGLLSLFIETNQAFLLSRSSSLTDLVWNILGSGIGVVVYWGVERIIPYVKFQIPEENQEP